MTTHPPTTVVSFFTDHRYLREASKLRDTARIVAGLKMQDDHEIIPGSLVISEVEDRKNWALNNQQKVPFVTMWLMLTKGPVMWVDADCLMFRNPDEGLAELVPDAHDYDILHARLPHPRTGELQLFASTLWFNYTENTLRFMDAWLKSLPSEAEVRANPNEFDLSMSEQVWMERTIKRWQREGLPLRVGYLPPEFACVYDLTPFDHPDIKPVISAYQVSRIAKMERALCQSAS